MRSTSNEKKYGHMEEVYEEMWSNYSLNGGTCVEWATKFYSDVIRGGLGWMEIPESEIIRHCRKAQQTLGTIATTQWIGIRELCAQKGH